jgi:hypothetical protein
VVHSWEGDGGGQGGGGARGPAAGASDGATPTPLPAILRWPNYHSSLARLPSSTPAGLLLRFGERAPPSAPGGGFYFGASSLACSSSHPLRQALLRIQRPACGSGLPQRDGAAAQASTTQAWPRSSRSTTSGLPVIARVLQQPFFTTELISKLIKDCEAMMGVIFPAAAQQQRCSPCRRSEAAAPPSAASRCRPCGSPTGCSSRFSSHRR